MEKIMDDDMIKDVQRIARILNTNELSFREYLENGGKFSEDIINNCKCGGWANNCELAGVKVKVDK